MPQFPMPVPPSVDLVLFGIQAALRINSQFRRAYADSTRSRAITLPLPNFPSATNLAEAEGFYIGPDGQRFVNENLRVRHLLQKLNQAGELPSDEEKELIELYREHAAIVRAQAGILVESDNSAGAANEDIYYLLRIRQWRPGEDPNPTMLRRMAGTFINIATDYFVGHPDLISTQSTRGKALRGLLEAIDSLDFAEDGRAKITEQLFIAGIETIRDYPELISGDEKSRILVGNIFKGVYENAKEHIDATSDNLSKQDRIRDLSQLVLRSALSSAGETVLAEPDKFLAIGGEAEGELVRQVGGSILDAILDEDSNGVNLMNLFTEKSLDGVVKAALTVVGDYPQLLVDNNQGLKNLVSATAEALADSSKEIGIDLLPEAIRLILENTGQNLELLMPQGPNQPDKNLLIIAAKEVLKQLAAPPPDNATWKVQFGSAEALKVIEVVIEEVVENPGWVLKTNGEVHELLGDVTKEVLETLRKVGQPRLKKETGLTILEAAIRAVGKRLEFLDKDPQNRLLISQTLEVVFTTIFNPDVDAKATWVLARDTVINQIVEVVLEKLAQYGITTDNINKVKQQIEAAISLLSEGGRFALDDFTNQLEQDLATGG